MGEEVHILDCELQRLIGSYPVITDASFVATIKLYYLMTGENVKSTDFKSLSKEEINRTSYVFGPIITRSLVRKNAAIAAINEFIINVLKLPFEPLPTPRHEVGTIRHVNFIEWVFYDKEYFLSLWRLFWSCNTQIPRSNFIFVLKRPKDDIVVCTHTLSGDLSLPLQEKREIEVKKHITICLEKKEEDLNDKSQINFVNNAMFHVEHPWRALIGTNMSRETQTVADRWRTEHPYYARCIYNERGIIALTPEEKMRFTTNPRHAKLVNDIEQGKSLSPADVVEISTELSHFIAKREQAYAAAGYDTIPFIFYHSLTLSEMIKMFAAPPPPRALPTVTLLFDQGTQDSAATIGKVITLMNVVSGTPGRATSTKGKIVLVADKSDPNIRAFLEGNFSDFTWQSLNSHTDWLENENVIADFLNKLASGWNVPSGSIVSTTPTLCDAHHHLYSSFPFTQVRKDGARGGKKKNS